MKVVHEAENPCAVVEHGLLKPFPGAGAAGLFSCVTDDAVMGELPFGGAEPTRGERCVWKKVH